MAITVPTQKKYVKEAATIPFHTANSYAAEVKDHKYVQPAKNAGKDFYALVVETSGGWCDSGAQVIYATAKMVAAREEEEVAPTLKRVHQRLSCVLQRANSVSFLGSPRRTLG